MSKTHLKVFIGGPLILSVVLVSCQLSGLPGMFQPHTYNWGTGMPSLRDQVAAFQESNKRWPTDYGDLVTFMKQTITNFVPESYDRIEFTTKSDGMLEISVYVSDSGITNYIFLTPPHKH